MQGLVVTFTIDLCTHTVPHVLLSSEAAAFAGRESRPCFEVKDTECMQIQAIGAVVADSLSSSIHQQDAEKQDQRPQQDNFSSW